MSKKLWYKFDTKSKGTYFSPFSKSKSTLKHYDTITDLVYETNKQEATFDYRGDNVVEFYYLNETSNEPIDLPVGVYHHRQESSSTPEGLFPMEIRKDGYIPIIKELDNLKSEITNFKNNKKLYDDCKTIYKLGVLLFGPPGTGKTSFMREFIRDNQEAIIIFLDGVPSRKFLEILENSTKDKLKIFVFEEVVAMLEDSFDIRHTLDFLDGSTTISNSIYFMSTNYPEVIPENVIRNGRIDMFVNVTYPDYAARKQLIELYLDRPALEEEISLTQNLPIVDIRQICFTHKKTNKSFIECSKIIEEKAKMIKKHFGKTKSIQL
jgi:hypothetical protein